jgi:hypothetical protein
MTESKLYLTKESTYIYLYPTPLTVSTALPPLAVPSPT